MNIRLSRRGFLRGLLGTAGAAIVAPLAAARETLTVNVEHGFTWLIKDKIADKKFSDIITETLRKNNSLLANNLSKNNTILLRLKDKDAVINVEKISPELQQERMQRRIEARMLEKGNKYYSQVREGYIKHNVQDTADFKFYEAYEQPKFNLGAKNV